MKFKLKRSKPLEQSVSSRKVPAKKTLYIVLASLIVLAVVGGSIAAFQRHQERKAAEDRAFKQQVETIEADRMNKYQALQAENAVLKNRNQVLCTYLDNAQRTKPTRGLVTIPTAGGCTVQ